jgi:hypothetical protein
MIEIQTGKEYIRLSEGRGTEREVFIYTREEKIPREIMELAYTLITLSGQALEKNVTPH